MNNFALSAMAPVEAHQRRSYAPPAFVQELVLETRAGSPPPGFQEGYKDIVDPILGLPPTPNP